MFLYEFENYRTEYEKGARRISVRSGRLLSPKQRCDSKPEPFQDNDDLFFNRKGLLLHSVHKRRNKNYKVIYGYNHREILVRIMSLLSETNTLQSLSEFEYDEKGRLVKEVVRSFYFGSGSDDITEIIHAYDGNNETVFMTTNVEDADEYTIYTIYDSKRQVIEEKSIRNEDELINWFRNEYDADGNLIKEISLDENGETEGIVEYIHFDNGLSSGYHYKSKETSYQREYFFKYNERGHWIHQVTKDNGEPKYFFDRTIEYY